MKKLLLIAIALIGLQFTAEAQRRGGGDNKDMSAEDMATKRTEKMVEQLGLDASQKDAVYAINLEEAQARKAKMDARKESEKAEKPSDDEREKMREDRKKQREAYKAKLKDILTAEQFAKLEESGDKGGERKGRGKKDK